MKVAPILKVFSKLNTRISIKLVHTGQHYVPNLNSKPSEELGLPCPDFNLYVGSGSHAWETGEIMHRFEPVLFSLKPRYVLVVGDVNSSLACALVAVKLGIPVVHVEAGLRSGDHGMSEEINRLIINRISDRLYVTERTTWDNLIADGIKAEQISFAGNVMIDSLKTHLNESPEISSIAARYGIPLELISAREGFALVTWRRPSNVDDTKKPSKLLYIFGEIAKCLPLIFIFHPRTQGKIAQFCLVGLFAAPDSSPSSLWAI